MIVRFPQLHAYLDESADEKQEKAFCIGAFLANEEARNAIQAAWVKQLEKDEIAYFRASDCKAVKGAFARLRKEHSSLQLAREAAAKIRENLEAILLPISALWMGFGLSVDVPDHTAVRNAFPESALFYSRDPTVAAYSQMIYTIARAARKNAPGHRVAFVFDGSSASSKIMAALDAIKEYHPVVAKSIATIAPADDKLTPPLQMADLVASVVRKSFLKHKETGEAFPERWNAHFGHDESLGIWDAEHTLRSLVKTVRSKRFVSGRLTRQGPPPKLSKRDIKANRRALIAKEKGRN